VTTRADVAIVGGGPGGATAAMFLLKEGVRPLIIERDDFPRYHIGESMSGEVAGIIRELGLEDRMRAAGHPRKQGVNVYGPRGEGSFWVPVMRRTTDGLEDAETWQVRRSDFDVMMLEEARARGVEVLRAEALEPLWTDDGRRMTGLRVRRRDGTLDEVRADVTLDASGQRTFFAHRGVTSDKVPGRYDRQVAVFSQVANPVRDQGGPDRARHPDNTLIFYKAKVHWAWFIPLDDELVSVGVVAPNSYFASKKETKAAYLRRELAELNPELARRVTDATLVEEARAIPNYSYHCRTFGGPGWLCLGDAHRFIDPIFSFGLYVSMREAQLSAPVIADALNRGPDRTDGFRTHQDRLEAGLELIQRLIDGFWESPLGFAHLAHGRRCREDIIDLFAGRIYDNPTSEGIRQLQQLVATAEAKRSANAGQPAPA
jgi:flavin-dependent dehydrogenase